MSSSTGSLQFGNVLWMQRRGLGFRVGASVLGGIFWGQRVKIQICFWRFIGGRKMQFGHGHDGIRGLLDGIGYLDSRWVARKLKKALGRFSYLGNIKTYLFIPPCSMALQGIKNLCTCSNKQQRYTVTGESDVSLKFLVLEGVITPRLWYKKQERLLISKLCFYVVIACQGFANCIRPAQATARNGLRKSTKSQAETSSDSFMNSS